jgi:hypothetical protein
MSIIRLIHIKIDTGARTSSNQTRNLKLLGSHRAALSGIRSPVCLATAFTGAAPLQASSWLVKNAKVAGPSFQAAGSRTAAAGLRLCRALLNGCLGRRDAQSVEVRIKIDWQH